MRCTLRQTCAQDHFTFINNTKRKEEVQHSTGNSTVQSTILAHSKGTVHAAQLLQLDMSAYRAQTHPGTVTVAKHHNKVHDS